MYDSHGSGAKYCTRAVNDSCVLWLNICSEDTLFFLGDIMLLTERVTAHLWTFSIGKRDLCIWQMTISQQKPKSHTNTCEYCFAEGGLGKKHNPFLPFAFATIPMPRQGVQWPHNWNKGTHRDTTPRWARRFDRRWNLWKKSLRSRTKRWPKSLLGALVSSQQTVEVPDGKKVIRAKRVIETNYGLHKQPKMLSPSHWTIRSENRAPLQGLPAKRSARSCRPQLPRCSSSVGWTPWAWWWVGSRTRSVRTSSGTGAGWFQALWAAQPKLSSCIVTSVVCGSLFPAAHAATWMASEGACRPTQVRFRTARSAVSTVEYESKQAFLKENAVVPTETSIWILKTRKNNSVTDLSNILFVHSLSKKDVSKVRYC